ncbi:hypothetical protein AAEY33_20490 [Peribacillus simplex]|uniref:hypothetical protein n=1 Tax=Peribacillus simplex TaxID=1478 RepID=UPI00326682E2
MSTCNAHYMNASFELTIWNVSVSVAAENDWNEKRQNFIAFIPQDVLLDILECKEYLSN